MRYLIPISGISLLSSSAAIKLSAEYPSYTKALEVYFYSQSGTNTERIKVWIEDLKNISKVQYHDSSSNSWKKLSWENGDKYKRYSFLSQLASYYIQVQHLVNIVKHMEWLGDNVPESIWHNSICCSQDSNNQCPDNFSADSTCNSDEIIKNQKRFSLYLTNLASFKGSVYFSPIQVHIKLPDNSNFDELINSNSREEKNLIGSMVYGFVDYYYKPLNFGLEDSFYKHIKPNLDIGNGNESYYANYPQLFKFKYDKGKILAGSNTNLLNIYKDLKNKRNLLKKYGGGVSSHTCNDISCIINRNYVQKLTDLGDIQNRVKNFSTCLSKK